MPQVPTYSRPRVGRNQIPGVRVSGEAPASAFMPQKGIDLAPTLDIVAKTIEREQVKADQIALTAADARASRLETDLLHGQNGVLYREGKNAFGAPEEVGEAWSKGVSQIMNELKTPQQKEAFAQRIQQRWTSIDTQVQRHVASERNRFDLAESKNLIQAESDAAIKNYNDPERVQQSIGRTVEAITALGQRQGWGESTLESAVSGALSNIHAGVIDAMLTDDQDITAQNYYNKYQDQISGEASVKIKASLEEGSLRGKSQRESDKIYTENRGNQGAALEAARQIEDPKLRDETERRLLHRFSVDRQVERESENDAYVTAANYIDAKPGRGARAAVPPALWNTLKPTQRRSLEIYANGGRGSGGSSSSSNEKVWLDFLELDTDDVKDLTRSEFETKYLSKLGASDRSRAITRWKNAREGKGANDPDEKRTFTLAEDIKGSLKSANLISSFNTKDLSDKEKNYITSVDADVEQARYDFASKNKRKPTPSEERTMVDQAVMKTFFAQGGKKLRLRTEEGNTAELQRRGGRLYFDYDKIPAGRRQLLVERSRELGGKASRDAIERAYAASLVGDRNAVEAALKER